MSLGPWRQDGALAASGRQAIQLSTFSGRSLQPSAPAPAPASAPNFVVPMTCSLGSNVGVVKDCQGYRKWPQTDGLPEISGYCKQTLSKPKRNSKHFQDLSTCSAKATKSMVPDGELLRNLWTSLESSPVTFAFLWITWTRAEAAGWCKGRCAAKTWGNQCFNVTPFKCSGKSTCSRNR